MKCLRFIVFGFIVSSFSILLAEEHEHNMENEPHHKFSGIMANSLIQNSFEQASNDVLIVPTFGINYDYFFASKFGLGLHTDILLQQFKVERHNDNTALVRDNPIAMCIMGVYKPIHQICVVAGYGQEFEKHESLHMIRIGFEYEIPIRKNWEVGFDVEYDIKLNAYGTLMFGVAFSKTVYGRK